MALPDRDTVMDWVGQQVVDADGEPLGTCGQVYADDDTGTPEWLSTEGEDGAPGQFLPLVDATSEAGQVRLSVRREAIASAPRTGVVSVGLTPEEEAQLYGHYGINYSRESSGSLLPAGEQPAEPAERAEPAAADSEPASPAAAVGSTEAAANGGGTAPARLRRIGTSPTPEPAGAVTSPPQAARAAEQPSQPAAPARWPDAADSDDGGGSGVRAAAVPAAVGILAAVLAAAVAMLRRRRQPEPPAQRWFLEPARNTGAALGTAAELGVGLANAATARMDTATRLAAARSAQAAAAAREAGARLGGGAATLRAPAARATGRLAGGGRTAVQQARTRGGPLTDAARTGLAVAAGTARTGRAAATGTARGGLAAARTGLGATTTVTGGTLRAARWLTGTAASAPRAVAHETSEAADAVRTSWRKTMGKITAAIGFGVGYVLGARAGQERYQQIAAKAGELAERPEVAKLREKVTGAASAGTSRWGGSGAGGFDTDPLDTSPLDADPLGTGTLDADPFGTTTTGAADAAEPPIVIISDAADAADAADAEPTGNISLDPVIDANTGTGYPDRP